MTPSGLLQRGDRIRNINSGVECEVTERIGNGADYSIRMKRVDGEAFPDGRHEKLMTEVGYWLRNGWIFVEPQPTPKPNLDAIDRALAVHAKSGLIRSYAHTDNNRWTVITTTADEARLTDAEAYALCVGLASAAHRVAAFVDELRKLEVHVGIGRVDPECVTCRTAWPCTKAAVADHGIRTGPTS